MKRLFLFLTPLFSSFILSFWVINHGPFFYKIYITLALDFILTYITLSYICCIYGEQGAVYETSVKKDGKLYLQYFFGVLFIVAVLDFTKIHIYILENIKTSILFIFFTSLPFIFVNTFFARKKVVTKTNKDVKEYENYDIKDHKNLDNVSKT